MHGRMALPKEISFVTFDVYGTLIDWETGAYDAFAKEAEKDGYTLSREELVPLFLEIQQEIKGGSYELYAEVLRRTAVQISRQLGWPLEPSRSGFLPESVKRWPAFKETKRRIGTKTKWVHIATGLETDVLPATKLKVPTIWVDRKKQGWPPGQKGKPAEIVKDVRSAVKLLGAA
jgi:FMN phosphatase YigB (HAD superfamily)